jgi:transposase
MMQLYREIQSQGYRGTDSNVRKYLRSWRQHSSDKAENRNQPVPSSRTLAHLVTQREEALLKEAQAVIEQLKGAHEHVSTCITLAQEFTAMIRQRLTEKFTQWVQAARDSGVSALVNFAQSLLTDEAAVRAALESEWSNGQTEGFVNKLKLLKRQMYGRAKLDLLKIRLLALTRSTKSA